ncbi:MAG: hypothetical protein K6G83_02040 [Lachnospiraceae bacterium]|nr:hypothetical protein [Lachnospiraceae bacterium]
MTLDEAIKHAEEVARKEQEKGFDLNTHYNCETEYGKKCYKCAAEHRQLAEWLKDYKRLLGAIEDIKAEIDKLKGINSAYYIAIEDVKEVIDKYISGNEPEDQ